MYNCRFLQLTLSTVLLSTKVFLWSGTDNLPLSFSAVRDKTPQPTMNGTHPVTPQPPSTGPPKAMVKPQVLTHVIEGFVIHEGKTRCMAKKT